jgi:lipoprotein-anchoring transpeptidase ErfK/SrfK
VSLVSGTGCKGRRGANGAPSASAPPSAAASGSAAPDHGQLDTATPADAPKLAATAIATTIYQRPDVGSRKLGYARLGAVLRRDREPTKGQGCRNEWYRVYPMGFVCTDEATVDLEDPLVRATRLRPDLGKPLPYRYGFVRATAPQYLRVPTKAEQTKSEFKLEEHLASFGESRAEWQKVLLGANDIPLDERGIARPGLALPPGQRISPEMSEIELFGGRAGRVPWWLEGGRKIPNISGFQVPDYAVFADRVRRKTGLSFVDAFHTESEGMARDFGVTVDMRLIPLSKVKPDSASPFHGVELGDKLALPFAFVLTEEVKTYKLIKGKDEAKPLEAIPRRAIVPLTGNARIKAGRRFYQTARDKKVWLRAEDLAVVDRPGQWPEFAEQGEKWIDISLGQQTLVLYQGKKPWYATLVSSGRDRLGDPEKTLSTPRGTFRIRSKHTTAAMDSEENSSVAGGTRAHRSSSSGGEDVAARLEQAEKEGKKLPVDDQRRLLNLKKGRDVEYGVTMRRGAASFELRDVPWIQYFASGYAVHGAYWHDVFGIPRSHGCVNLAPIDAKVVFRWTDPSVPEGWQGVNVGDETGRGTAVVVRE